MQECAFVLLLYSNIVKCNALRTYVDLSHANRPAILIYIICMQTDR